MTPGIWRRNYYRLVATILAVCVLYQYLSIQSFSFISATSLTTCLDLTQHQDDSTTTDKHNTKELSWAEFQDLNEQLFSHDFPATGCPSNCGCPGHKFDCPQMYSLVDVNASAEATLSLEAEKEFKIFLKMKHKSSQEFCKSANERDSAPTGGYCLFNLPNSLNITLPNGHEVHFKPPGHAEPSLRIVWEVVELLTKDGAKSLNDFGAGVGQFASAIASELATDFQYNAYDGAGNIEEFTNSYIRFADLSGPVNVPKADWVMSLEVGEHVPARFEGMFLRNLHRHNCKGVILSWAVLGQDGLHHVNEHSNAYIARAFNELGYTRDKIWEQRLRQEPNNHYWFVWSSFVFRRNVSVC